MLALHRDRPLLSGKRRHGEYAMSLPQITVGDWFLVFGIVVGWSFIIIFMVATQRKLSRPRADFKLLSDQLTDLTRAEEIRLMREIRDPKNKGRGRSVTGRKEADGPSPSLGPQ
jgi:hypothetical protein